ncbi:MAG: ABC transporter ATP-binding protein [Candidatus Zixiibacteriota bacterium]|jgi:ABC-2 type transport system ATP-binding protein
MISVTNIKKTFDSLTAVDDVSFEIQQGEIFGLLGPNGAGKTTTINMMVGALKPDSGQVSIDGGGDPMRTEIRMKIGAAPQALAIYEDLTAEENVVFFGRLYGIRGRQLKERVDWTLELVGLTERRRDRASAYSGGMKRRLNLACSLVHDPEILLFDEPTVGVDPQSRNLIFDKIEMLRGQGRTIVYTTHYMEEAQRLCDRVAIIDHGKILDLDTVDNLIDRHGGEAVVTALLESPNDISVDLPGQLEGDQLRFTSSRPLEEVARLNSSGVRFRSLKVDRADLESVFLNLTGRRLRD